jgi:hypothetical protein
LLGEPLTKMVFDKLNVFFGEGHGRSGIENGSYTSYRHNITFVEYLEFQCEQGIKFLFVRCVCLIEAVRY